MSLWDVLPRQEIQYPKNIRSKSKVRSSRTASNGIAQNTYHRHVWVAVNDASDISHLHFEVCLPNISNHTF